MSNSYEIDKLRIQQFGLTTTVKDDSGKEHYFYRGHEYIEIGGLKWAVSNVGAEQDSDGGLYFAFGETQGYTIEQAHSCKRKFIREEYTDVEFDAVNTYWGGKWRLPTEEEFDVLISATTREWVKDYQGSGVNGRLFTSKTDSSKKLFFPAVGHYYSGIVYDFGLLGYYWSSSLIANGVTSGMDFNFDDTSYYKDYDSRYLGFSVRGVVGE